MRHLVAAAVLCACGPGLKGAGAKVRNPKLYDFAGELSRASRAHDVVAVRTMLRDHVTIGGLWFEDVKCQIAFGAPARISGSGLDELARCLTTLDLAPSSRTDMLPEVAILTYGAGLELESRFLETEQGPWLNWIGYVARRDMADALPTISAAALEALRIEGDAHAPLTDPSSFVETTKGNTVYAWLKICIDSTGTVSGTHPRQASSPKAARAFAALVQTWKFQPFVLRSQPAPVCAMVLLRQPVDPKAKEVLPWPLPADTAALLNIAPSSIGRPINAKYIAPDGIDQDRIRQSGVETVYGIVHFCIDESGHVNRAAIIRSTGFAGYDRKLVDGVSTWSFAPYLDEGKAVSVCSATGIAYQPRFVAQPGMMKFGDSR